jgi:GH15 family glucan-1,4-alpha-glucosidase
MNVFSPWNRPGAAQPTTQPSQKSGKIPPKDSGFKLHLLRVRTFLIAIAMAASFTTLEAAVPDDAGGNKVDFRYSPPWWQTAICLPDDADKTLVGREGQVLLDFGSGGPRNFGISIQPDEGEGAKWIRQQTISSRAPVVQTWKNADGVEMLEETFVVPPRPGEADVQPRLARTDGHERLNNWAKPARPCVAAFTGVDVAYNGRPIQLKQATAAGSKATVVFGLCEGWHKVSGKRPLVLKVEGAEPQTVDPVKDFGVNEPGLYMFSARDANGDGFIDISIATPEGSADRNSILNALWVFDGPAPLAEKILNGEADAEGVEFYCGNSVPSRRSVVLVTMKNTSAAEVKRQPVLRVHSIEPVRQMSDGSIMAGIHTRISSSEALEFKSPPSGQIYLVRTPRATLPPGGTRKVAFTVDRHTSKPAVALKSEEASRLRDTTQQWWEKGGLPFDAIQVPDAGIQAMLESSVRNIWQAREIKQGKPAFHVGPTVYRGLWVVDGSFLLESAALVGRGQDARAGVEYLLSHQKPDGSFDILGHFWKENGIVLWAATRHAFLTQDKQWLKTQWPALQRVVGAIRNMRALASKDPAAPNYRLLPGGEIDGGISNGGPQEPEFSNTHWCLAGLKAAIAAAHWIGDEANASDWQREFDDFNAVFRKAAVRDRLKDRFGNAYVPQMMGNARKLTPQKGQWTFCHAIYPGQIFSSGDALAASQMAMLRATKVEGMVFDTGWMRDGLWSYFASFYGHAALWMGEGREAAQMLYAFANHACPTRVWREEQKPLGMGNDEVGDMPHNWASAEFIRLTAHLLELDRGDKLHLLEGIPAQWLGPGMVTRLEGVLTPFGPLHMTVEVDKEGKSAALEVKPLAANCKAIVVHPPSGAPRELPPAQGGIMTFQIRNR